PLRRVLLRRETHRRRRRRTRRAWTHRARRRRPPERDLARKLRGRLRPRPHPHPHLKLTPRRSKRRKWTRPKPILLRRNSSVIGRWYNSTTMRLCTLILLSVPLYAAGDPTFYKDVLPILQERCQECHRSGEIGRMPLMTYQQTRPWAAAIKESVRL